MIDASSSMSAEAPIPTNNLSEKERNGLSVLDLVKHAARTILETLDLDENDRLGIVTFSSEAKIVEDLRHMTTQNKEHALEEIQRLKAIGNTNLWHRILEGTTVSSSIKGPC